MRFILITWLATLIVVKGSYWHPEQVPYAGNFIKSEIGKINFCKKNICVVDASRMGLWMNETANPCDNFYRYVCGSMLRYQALNERYPFQGLQQILYETINEQRRKVLADPIRPDDIRPHKIAKSLFQQCVDSRKVMKFGKNEFLNFIKSLGGFPMIEGEVWNSTKFNRSQLFVDFPTLMFDFFNLELEVGKFDVYSNFSYVFAKENFWHEVASIQITSNALKGVLQDLGIRYSKNIARQHKDVKTWMRMFVVENATVESLKPKTYETVSISAFNDFMNFNQSTLRVNWKQTLRSLLDFEVEDDFSIVVMNAKILRDKFEKLDVTSDRIFANFFFMRLLIEYRKTLSLYFSPENESSKLGTTNAPQRFEQCTMLVRINMPVAFASLIVKKYTNKRMIDDAKEIAHRTVKLITEIVENDETISMEHRSFMVEKLKSLKLVIGYPDELLEDKNVESLYKGLTLIGNETFFELFLQSSLFDKATKFRNYIQLDKGKLKRNESTKWTDYTTEDEYVTPLYVMNYENTIYYPSLWFQPPYFNPDRPRYYKDSMFAIFLSYTINSGLKKYMKENDIPSKNGMKNHFDFISAIYKNYAEWDDEHHEDLPLPGFLFSNKQFFWFTLIHKNCIKLQVGYADEFNDEHNAEAYFHATKVFQEAFGCKLSEKNMTSDELNNFYNRYNEFY